MLKILAGILALTIELAPAAAQVPPPPAMPDQMSLSVALVSAFKAKDLKEYASLLADDVQVSEDGKIVATNKRDWLAKFAPPFLAEGVSFKLMPGYSATGRLLFIEYFNSLESWGRTPPPDCCWGYDAVAYDVREGKIARIQKLRGGTEKLDDKGRPVGP